jgi:hypothetical protein
LFILLLHVPQSYTAYISYSSTRGISTTGDILLVPVIAAFQEAATVTQQRSKRAE